MMSIAYFDNSTNSNSFLMIIDDFNPRDSENRFNFIYAKVNTLVEKQITIIQNYKNGTLVIENQNTRVSKAEAEMFMEFFEIVALTKIANYLGIPVPLTSEAPEYLPLTSTGNNTELAQLNFLEKRQPRQLIAVAAVIVIAKGVIDVVEKLGKVFGSSTRTALKEIIKGEGFSKFSQNTRVDVNKGIKIELKEKFFERIVQTLAIPAHDKQDFLEFVSDVKDFGPEEKRFLTTNFLFSSGDPVNPLRYLMIVFMEDHETGKFDFFWSSVTASFALADDIFVMQTNKHKFAYDSETIEFRRNPRNITPEDIKTVTAYMEIVGLNSLCKVLGIPISVPPLN